MLCALAAAGLRYAARPLDRWLDRIEISREVKLLLAGGFVVALLVGAALARAPQRIADARETFTRGQYMTYSSDLRTRLTSAVDNGRIDNWRVAIDGFDAQPFHGTGAGTYRITWDHDRPAPPVKVNDGHSLYLETMSELGIVGLVLLLTALGTMLVGGLVRLLRGEERYAHGAFVATGTMLAIHAGIDWDWEMPALFVWLFGAGGVVLAARRPRFGELGRLPRVISALAVLVLAMTPALFAYSQGPLDRAVTAFGDRDCKTAIDDALTATERFGTRPEPWMVVGYCDARYGQYALARRAMDAARERDPNNWQYAYGQAIVYGVSGLDPRPYAREALRLNPLDPDAVALVKNLDAAKTAAARRDVTVRATIPSGDDDSPGGLAVVERRRPGAPPLAANGLRGLTRRACGAPGATAARPAASRGPLTTARPAGCGARAVRRPCGAPAGLLLAARAAAQDQAAREQREAAEQDRDRREAGERQLARLGRGRLLAGRLRAGGGAGLLGRGHAGAGVGLRRSGFRRRRVVLLGGQDAALAADVGRAHGAALVRRGGRAHRRGGGRHAGAGRHARGRLAGRGARRRGRGGRVLRDGRVRPGRGVVAAGDRQARAGGAEEHPRDEQAENGDT